MTIRHVDVFGLTHREIVFQTGARCLIPMNEDLTQAQTALLARASTAESTDLTIALLSRLRTLSPGIGFAVEDAFEHPRTYETIQRLRIERNGAAIWVHVPKAADSVDAIARAAIRSFPKAEKLMAAAVAKSTEDARTQRIERSAAVILSGLIRSGPAFHRIITTPAPAPRLEGGGTDRTKPTIVWDRIARSVGDVGVCTYGGIVTVDLHRDDYRWSGTTLLIRESQRMPATMLSSLIGHPMDDIVTVPDLAGHGLMVEKASVDRDGRLRLTMRSDAVTPDEAMEIHAGIQS